MYQKWGLANKVVNGILAIQWDLGFTCSVTQLGTRPTKMLKFCGSLTLKYIWPFETSSLEMQNFLGRQTSSWPSDTAELNVSYSVSYFLPSKMIKKFAECQGGPFSQGQILSKAHCPIAFRSVEPWSRQLNSTWNSFEHTLLTKITRHRLTAVKVFNIFPVLLGIIRTLV